MRFVFLVIVAVIGHASARGDSEATRVLFVGNSYTYHRDVPALVQAMAASLGRALECAHETAPDYSLEDHWASRSQRRLERGGKWDWLIVQQGPSTAPENRAHLRDWVKRWAEVARQHGAQTAVFTVWPFVSQIRGGGFVHVSESHRAAAAHAGVPAFPVAEAWAFALIDDPKLRLYERDGLHSTASGAYLAALVITRGLTGLEVDAVPSTLMLPGGGRFTLEEERAAFLRRVVARVPRS